MTLSLRRFLTFFMFFSFGFLVLIAEGYAQNWNTKSNAGTNDAANRFSNERKMLDQEFSAERVETKEVVTTPQGQVDARHPIFKIIQSGGVDGVRFKNLNSLQNIYAQNNYAPIFLGNSRRAQNDMNAYYEAFLDSWSHGFNPARYHTKTLYKFLSAESGMISDDDILKADVILADAVIRHGQDLTGSRIAPSKMGYHAPSINQGVVAEEIIEFVKDSRDPQLAFNDMAPDGDLYKMLRDELVRLYEVPNESTEYIDFEGLINPRTTNRNIPKLRKRMGSRSDNLVHGEEFYDDELASTVMAFQRANGLKDDGVIGPATARVINISNKDKIKKLLVNMERIRWEDQDKPDRYLLVNIPNELLWAIDGGRVEVQMPVVVGRPERATKAFNAKITGVRINPTWTIPPTIKREDFATKLRRDAAYLDNRGIKVYKGGKAVRSSSINWNNVSESQLGAYTMVQGPGSSNPLGRYRVLMNNPYNIYLHDTPTKTYFARANRALSSGCVRMEDAERITDFILRKNPNWSQERKQKILDSGDMTEVSAGESLPVYLQYKTIWLGDNNQLVYGNDIYDEDSKLFNALRQQQDVLMPEEINL